MASSSKRSRQTHKAEAGNNQTQNKRQARTHQAVKTRNKSGEMSAASKQRKGE
jgi:hypothetical protein